MSACGVWFYNNKCGYCGSMWLIAENIIMLSDVHMFINMHSKGVDKGYCFYISKSCRECVKKWLIEVDKDLPSKELNVSRSG